LHLIEPGPILLSDPQQHDQIASFDEFLPLVPPLFPGKLRLLPRSSELSALGVSL
jgi:hypothetical protein